MVSDQSKLSSPQRVDSLTSQSTSAAPAQGCRALRHVARSRCASTSFEPNGRRYEDANPRQTKLGDLGEQMGAIHSLDLTSAVTHLLVGDIDTAKYKHVAKARPEIHVLSPEWISAVREAWIEGGSVDVDSLNKQYRLPTFSRLRICVTGFSDCTFIAHRARDTV